MKRYLKNTISGLAIWRILVIGGLSVSILALTCAVPMAAEYPEREITFIVPQPPGGGTDVIARYIADSLKRELGKSVIVVNKPGAGGAAGLRALVASNPDGYTISANSTSMISQKYVAVTYVDRNEVEAIALTNSDPHAFIVRADAPWKTIKDALLWAKENPGKLTVANGGTGNFQHLCMILLEKKTNVKFTHAPFNGGNPSVLAAAGGHVDAVAVTPSEAKFLVDAGKVRILAIATEQRDHLFPNVPTYRESGIDLVEGIWRGIVAPKGTPKPIIAKLAASIRKTINSSEFKKFLERGAYGWSFQGPEEFAATMARNDDEYSKIIPGLGLQKQ
jgi:tripartite-type tricarboxylate transporter receptor subunit TctC